MKSMNKLLALLLALSLCLGLLAGCKKTEAAPESSAPAAVSSAPAESAEPEASAEPEESAEGSLAQETVAEASVPAEENEAEGGGDIAPAADYPYDYTVKMDVTGVDFDELSKLDNESVPYGFATADRDDLNRPNGIYYYDSIYKDIGNGVTHIDTDEKIVYLTMDEGYEAGHTPKILDTLKEKGVKAVFFITKQFFDEHPELIQRMIDEGHIIGNHTCAHKAGGMPQMGAEAQYEDYKWLNDAVYDKFGYQMRLFRYPEGVSSKQSMALLNMMGYKAVFWSFAYRDFVLDDQMDPSEALFQCVDQCHPGAVYLLHAVSSTNTEILGDFIDSVREEGYDFGVFPVETAPAVN
jgi:delta-lactam-biosynthetic de-N-acetylase